MTQRPPRPDHARALIDWAATDGRRMPWRETADRYQLAVAEVLLQKTRGDAVQAVWARLLDRYPSADDLASARPEDVMGIVGGLGLRSQRAERLLAMARAIRDGAERVPGIGPYGSAVLALSASEPIHEAPVDGNVARVVSRLRGLSFDRGEPRKKAAVKDAVRELLAASATADERLATVYALVDLGATVCTPRSPKCAGCPLSAGCHYVESSRAA